MKPNVLHIGLAVVLLLAAAPNARSQSTFVNLDFESAHIIPDPASPYYPNAVSMSNGLPGWSAYGGTFSPGQDIIYDTLSLGAAAISIHDANGLIPAEIRLDDFKKAYSFSFRPPESATVRIARRRR